MVDWNKVKALFGSTLARSFGIYTITRVISSSIPFFLLPVMTSYLSPTDYGIISMITTVAAFVLPIVTLGVDSAVVRRYYYKNDNLAQYIGNCIVIVTFAWLFTTMMSIYLLSTIIKLTQIPQFVVYFVPLYCFLGFFKSILMYYWQVNKQPIKYGVFSIGATLLEISIALYLVVGRDFDWIGRAISMFAAAVILAIYAYLFFKTNRLIEYKYNPEQVRHALKYGLGTVPGTIGSALMTIINRLFITNMVGIDETGLYGVACSFGDIMSFVTVSFNNAFVPWLFEKLSLKDSKEKKKIVKLTYFVMLGMFILAFLILLVVLVIFPFFVNDKFDGSMKYIPWLLLGHAFQGCYLMVTNYIMYVEKTYYTAFIALGCGVVNVLLNYLLISRYSAIGASIAYASTFLLFFLVTWIISSRLYKMPWFNLKKSLNEC